MFSLRPQRVCTWMSTTQATRCYVGWLCSWCFSLSTNELFSCWQWCWYVSNSPGFLSYVERRKTKKKNRLLCVCVFRVCVCSCYKVKEQNISNIEEMEKRERNDGLEEEREWENNIRLWANWTNGRHRVWWDYEVCCLTSTRCNLTHRWSSWNSLFIFGMFYRWGEFD